MNTSRRIQDGMAALTKKVVRADRSLMNAKRWCCELECGHEVWVTRDRKPGRAACLKCGPGKPVAPGDVDTARKIADDYTKSWPEVVEAIHTPPPLTLDSPVRAVLEALEGLHVTQTEHNEPRRNATDDGFESDKTELSTSVEYARDAWGNPAVKRLAVMVDGTGPASVLEAYVKLANEVRKARAGK